MRIPFTRPETTLLLAVAALLALALLGPFVSQPADAHGFADRRAWGGLPNALDVLSNLPFAIAGAWGLLVLRRARAGPLFAMQRACAALFFAGLLVTAAGSTWYHLAPDDIGLAVDRTAMSVAFAGLLGLLAAARVSDRAGLALAAVALVAGPMSVFVWSSTGNVLAWAVVQFGGMAVVLLVLATGAERLATLPVRWGRVLAIYAIAKLLELGDHAILEAGGELLSGHSLKHVVAAFAAWPVIAALAVPHRPQNGVQTAVQAA